MPLRKYQGRVIIKLIVIVLTNGSGKRLWWPTVSMHTYRSEDSTKACGKLSLCSMILTTIRFRVLSSPPRVVVLGYNTNATFYLLTYLNPICCFPSVSAGACRAGQTKMQVNAVSVYFFVFVFYYLMPVWNTCRLYPHHSGPCGHDGGIMIMGQSELPFFSFL